MKYLTKIFVFLFLFFACSENSTEPIKEENKYWSVPTDEAIMLYFREFDSVRLDSMIAGKIQYRLDIAKSVVKDTTIKVHKDWRFGELLLYTTQELYNVLDTNKVRFNIHAIDTLLKQYEVIGIKSRSSTPSINSYNIHFLFPKYYNMIILSRIFSQINGITAERIGIGGSLLCTRRDIKLKIKKDIYKFIFSSCNQHIWVVQIVDDNIVDITDWDLIR